MPERSTAEPRTWAIPMCLTCWKTSAGCRCDAGDYNIQPVEVVELSHWRALEAERDQLEEALQGIEEYAKEGWEWLSEALDALGAETVFDIKERAAALSSAGPGGEQHEE